MHNLPLGLMPSQRFEQLKQQRQPFLERARESAKLTLPFLLPSHDGFPRPVEKALVTPYQGIGARGVNHLASKLLLTLLPPNSPFFRLVINEADLPYAPSEEEAQQKTDIEELLTRYERIIMADIETSSLRVLAFEALRHLIVTGNSLLYMGPATGWPGAKNTYLKNMPESPGFGMRVFNLASYVVHRSPSGAVLEILTQEGLVSEGLAPETQGVGTQGVGTQGVGTQGIENPRILTTHIFLENASELSSSGLSSSGLAPSWHVRQQMGETIVLDAPNSYPQDRSPWLPLRLLRMDGESYGRGLIEEYLGDLKTLDALTQAVVEGSTMAAKVTFLVKPNSIIKEQKLEEAKNGAILTGNVDDIGVLQVGKYGDFQVAKGVMEHVEQRLSYAFLLNSSIQRQGERVTAEEIRHMAGELEDTLGGVYSVLSQEFQRPLIQRLMYQMEAQGRLPRLPQDMVKPMIVTGLEALGRGYDLVKLQSFVGDLAQLGQIFPPLLQRVNVDALVSRLAQARGMSADDLLNPPGDLDPSVSDTTATPQL